MVLVDSLVLLFLAFSLSAAVPSSRSPAPTASPSTKVSIPVTVVVVSSVVVTMSITGIVAAIVSRKKRRFTQWWIVRGYRQQLNGWETTVQIKTWAHDHLVTLRFHSRDSGQVIYNTRVRHVPWLGLVIQQASETSKELCLQCLGPDKL